MTKKIYGTFLLIAIDEKTKARLMSVAGKRNVAALVRRLIREYLEGVGNG